MYVGTRSDRRADGVLNVNSEGVVHYIGIMSVEFKLTKREVMS